MPSSLVAADQAVPRSSSRAVTVAPTTAPPEESVTRPVSPALTSCAKAGLRSVAAQIKIASWLRYTWILSVASLNRNAASSYYRALLPLPLCVFSSRREIAGDGGG